MLVTIHLSKKSKFTIKGSSPQLKKKGKGKDKKNKEWRGRKGLLINLCVGRNSEHPFSRR